MCIRDSANADNPEDAELSRGFGAEGIGLCRTEHMFLGDRKQIIQTFILNEDPAVREKAVGELLAAQTGDFLGMFRACLLYTSRRSRTSS